jgi:hypothetical protein
MTPQRVRFLFGVFGILWFLCSVLFGALTEHGYPSRKGHLFGVLYMYSFKAKEPI